jgi:hypothetical protein
MVSSFAQMFCPECRAEYRSGFTHCTDCDVDLVAELPMPEPEVDHTDLRHVWTGKNQEQSQRDSFQSRAESAPIPEGRG